MLASIGSGPTPGFRRRREAYEPRHYLGRSGRGPHGDRGDRRPHRHGVKIPCTVALVITGAANLKLCITGRATTSTAPLSNDQTRSSLHRGAPVIVERAMTRRHGDDRRSSLERRAGSRREEQRRRNRGTAVDDDRRRSDRRGHRDQRGGRDRRAGDRRAMPERRMMMAFS